MNVYTRPEFRRRGLATEVQKLMIADAKTLGLSNLELGAADQGAPVCRKFGFGAESPGLLAMELKLQPVTVPARKGAPPCAVRAGLPGKFPH